jgi:hypothetical protein
LVFCPIELASLALRLFIAPPRIANRIRFYIRFATAISTFYHPVKAALKAGIVELLGDDEDAIVDAMEDCGL